MRSWRYTRSGDTDVFLCHSGTAPERAICAREWRGGTGSHQRTGKRKPWSPAAGSPPSSGPRFPPIGAVCIYGVARRPADHLSLRQVVFAAKHQAGRDVFQLPQRWERVQELHPASEWLETMAELEVTESTCRLCGSPTRVVWATLRADDGRLIERRLLRMVCSSRECLALDVSVRAAEPRGRAANRARS